MGKGELTRERILEQTAPLFSQHGFQGTSMQQILNATGLEKGGIYRHFRSKEDLAAEAFQYALSLTTKTRTEHLDASLSATDKLRQYIRDFVHKPSPLRGGCVLLNTAVDNDDGNDRLRAMASKAFEDWRVRLEKLVLQGKKTGEIQSKVKPRKVANNIIAALEGALVLSRLQQTRQPLSDAAEMLLSLIDSIEA